MLQRFSQSLPSRNRVYSLLINHGDVPIQDVTRRISKAMGSNIISKKGMFQIADLEENANRFTVNVISLSMTQSILV